MYSNIVRCSVYARCVTEWFQFIWKVFFLFLFYFIHLLNKHRKCPCRHPRRRLCGLKLAGIFGWAPTANRKLNTIWLHFFEFIHLFQLDLPKFNNLIIESISKLNLLLLDCLPLFINMRFHPQMNYITITVLQTSNKSLKMNFNECHSRNIIWRVMGQFYSMPLNYLDKSHSPGQLWERCLGIDVLHWLVLSVCIVLWKNKLNTEKKFLSGFSARSLCIAQLVFLFLVYMNPRSFFAERTKPRILYSLVFITPLPYAH